jgi:NitT/TauT family transport system substrate-binding protein
MAAPGQRGEPLPIEVEPTGSGFSLTRRVLLGGLPACAIGSARAAPHPVVRLGILPFGTLQWVADVIARHQLDAAHGISLQPIKLASTEAGKVALLGRAVDVAVSDWPFVAAQRSHGGHLTFAPFSSSLGGIMVPAASRVGGLADLKGLRLGVAGGAADKSWLLVRAAARRQGIDLAREATLSFGAPPLLSAMLGQGSLDGLLTFWNFCARLQAAGAREAISVADCARTLGFAAPPVLVGYVFDADWARDNPAAIAGFLAATAGAMHILATDPAEWQRIRKLMDAPGEALFAALRTRFLAGIGQPSAAMLERQASQLLAILAADGLQPQTALPPGVFWQGA